MGGVYEAELVQSRGWERLHDMSHAIGDVFISISEVT